MVTGRKLKSYVQGFNGYQINMRGEIHLLNYYYPEYDVYGKLSKRIDRAGYYTVRLYDNGKAYTKYLHRLLAEAFISNPNSYDYVNHKDGNKLNNSLDNLEWVSHSLNIKHAYDKGLIKSKAKPVIDVSSGMIYNSTKKAATHLGIKHNTLRNYLNGGIKSNPTNLKFLDNLN